MSCCRVSFIGEILAKSLATLKNMISTYRKDFFHEKKSPKSPDFRKKNSTNRQIGLDGLG
jgi:hypothetical protein